MTLKSSSLNVVLNIFIHCIISFFPQCKARTFLKTCPTIELASLGSIAYFPIYPAPKNITLQNAGSFAPRLALISVV